MSGFQVGATRIETTITLPRQLNPHRGISSSAQGRALPSTKHAAGQDLPPDEATVLLRRLPLMLHLWGILDDTATTQIQTSLKPPTSTGAALCTPTNLPPVPRLIARCNHRTLHFRINACPQNHVHLSERNHATQASSPRTSSAKKGRAVKSMTSASPQRKSPVTSNL